MLKWPQQHQQLWPNSSASLTMIGSFSNPIMCEGWGHEVRSASSLALFFSYCFGGIFCFCPCTWMSTISYISQRLCLCVGWRDNGAVFLNAQAVALSFPFSHPPLPHLSSSPLNPFSHLSAPSISPVLPMRSSDALISSALFYLPCSFLPLYLAISLTLPPFSLTFLSFTGL